MIVLLAAVVAMAGACSSTSHGYGSAARAAFMETCAVRQQEPEAICGCMYDEISQQVPFDRYAELDKQMQNDEKFVPDELLRIGSDCASRQNSSSSSSSSSAPPRIN